jgi:hypothetical protein
MRRGNAEEAKRAKGGGMSTLIGASEAPAQGLCRMTGVSSEADGKVWRVGGDAQNLEGSGAEGI